MIHYENMTKDRIISLLKDALEYAEEKDKETERLNNIINGVEDLLKRFKGSYREIPIQIVLNEIRELKGSNSNE